MTIIGVLSEFSLPEVFQLLEQGHKTGQLTLRAIKSSPQSANETHHIWFRQGRIVAASDLSDYRGLLSLIQQRGWIDEQAAAKINNYQLGDTPLGLFLKSQGILDSEQLKLLFYVQVMQQVCALFRLPDAQFSFDSHQQLPMLEMTGLSSLGAEVTLAGLRALKDWSALEDKLPEPTSALTSLYSGKPHLHLNATEWQVWEFTDGKVSLKEIAESLQITIEKVQKIAFRLIVVNLTEELPMVHLTQSMDNLEPESSELLSSGENKSSGMSDEFLHSLIGFLQQKGA